MQRAKKKDVLIPVLIITVLLLLRAMTPKKESPVMVAMRFRTSRGIYVEK